ncbi:hypothetical protein NDU88_007282 [Pleurodeles waltl]|uniref:Uncharacterized protein n=1 Tax=Pleurodeles waltl TaxID=8319 RepID=A0AAV7LUZ7_PLEWA|nr:hypothetical protein NDU88_007282 [Pleurodeles waltl]
MPSPCRGVIQAQGPPGGATVAHLKRCVDVCAAKYLGCWGRGAQLQRCCFRFRAPAVLQLFAPLAPGLHCLPVLFCTKPVAVSSVQCQGKGPGAAEKDVCPLPAALTAAAVPAFILKRLH